MKLKIAMCLSLFLALAVVPTLAGSIPYPNIGTVAPTNDFTATATGSVTGYFYGFSAADTDEVQMCDVTQGYCSAFTFDNQTTTVSTSYNFGSVNAGDVLVFNLDNLSTGNILSSDPADSADGVNHAYATAYSGGGSIPAGVFIGMEDLTVPGSDLDYNDDQFVMTNVTIAPEPSSILLVAIGVLGVLMLKRRQFGLEV